MGSDPACHNMCMDDVSVARVGLAVLGGVMTVEAAFAGEGLDVDGGGSMKHLSHRLLTF